MWLIVQFSWMVGWLVCLLVVFVVLVCDLHAIGSDVLYGAGSYLAWYGAEILRTFVCQPVCLVVSGFKNKNFLFIYCGIGKNMYLCAIKVLTKTI